MQTIEREAGDIIDQANQQAAQSLSIALQRHQASLPTNRIVLELCEDCGNPIEPARREAKTVNNITQCIRCATEEEMKMKRYA